MVKGAPKAGKNTQTREIDEGNWIAYRAVLILLLCAVIGAGRMKTRDPSINQYTSACAVVVCVCVCLYKV